MTSTLPTANFRISVAFLSFATVFLYLSPCGYAQVAGSREAYQYMVEMQRAQMEFIANWNVARKIPTSDVFDSKKPSEEKQRLAIESVATGDIGWIDRYRSQVLSVIDDGSLIANVGDKTFWLEGISTSDLTSDMEFRLLGPVKVTGKKSYRNSLGQSRDVHLLEPLSIEEYQSFLVEQKRISYPKYSLRNGGEVQGVLKSFARGVFVFEGVDEEELRVKGSEIEKEDFAKLKAKWAEMEKEIAQKKKQELEEKRNASKRN